MATLIKEDGTGVANANTYVLEAELQAYADDREITLVGDLSSLLIQAMDYLESLVYKGIKKSKTQSLQWPRRYVYIDGYCFPSDEIPKELIKAQMAVAVSIDEGSGPLTTIDRSVKREKVDVIEIEYMDGAASVPIVRNITATLWKLLSGGGLGQLQVKRA